MRLAPDGGGVGTRGQTADTPQEVTDNGKLKTVEDLVREKGEKVTKGRVNMDGDIEYAP